MFKKWKKGGNVDAQKAKQIDDYYVLKKTIKHGFPYRPSALAYDHQLNLMAVANKAGEIKILGAPGVEFTTKHAGVNGVLQLHFINGQGKLVSVLDDNTLHLWSIDNVEKKSLNQQLKWKKSCTLPGRPGANCVTKVCISSDNSRIRVGSESGSIYYIDLPKFDICSSKTITPEQIVKSSPSGIKSNKLGPVEDIDEHPTNNQAILIGYQRGLIVLWDEVNKTMHNSFLSDKSLECLCWNSNGVEFMSAYSDGFISNWNVQSTAAVDSHAPYGPFPCKPITKLSWKTSKSHPLTIFTGGMPRANYGDRQCLSVIHETVDHVTFDFTSRIVDYFVFNNKSKNEPDFIVVLCDEELVCIDLSTPGWPSLSPPYLASLHASAITCQHLVTNVASEVFNKIVQANHQFDKSQKEWPITGGTDLRSDLSSNVKSLLLTGHEDGCVKVWDLSSTNMWQVLKVQTSMVFKDQDQENEEDYGEEFPPFRKIGEFDPYSDDPRLAVRKLSMCPLTGVIAAGGTAGQVVVFQVSQDSAEVVVPSSSVDLLQGRTDFTWKGHQKLELKNGHIAFKPGYQVSSILQCEPPASVTSINLNANWGLIGVGTSHGFGLFDYMQNEMVVQRCTLEAGEQLALEGNFSRVRSLKMSIRQSMRRIGSSFRGGSRRRSSRRGKKSGDRGKKIQEANEALVDESPGNTGFAPQQRRIEARAVDDGMTGMVRCTYFATTNLRDSVSATPTFWAGTNSGMVYCYALHIPDYSKRQDIQISFVAAKMVQLKHRAPVIDIQVVDSKNLPSTAPFEHENTPFTNTIPNGNQQKTSPSHPNHPMLIISSEEQIKLFSLPKFTPKRKVKLTATDGSRIRKVNVSKLTNEEYNQYNLVCMTNQGEVHIYAPMSEVRLMKKLPCIKIDNMTAISSIMLTNNAQGFYMTSQSELQRFSLTSEQRHQVEPKCRLVTSQSSNSGVIDEKGDCHVVDDSHQVDDPSLGGDDVIEGEGDAPKKQNPSIELIKKKSPQRKSKKLRSNASSPKTPLLGSDSEDDDDHVIMHQSVLEDVQRTLAEISMTTEEGDTHSDQEEGTHQVMTINVVRKDSKKNNYDVIETNSTSNASSEGGVDVEELMGAVAEAERVLNESVEVEENE